MPSNVTLVLMHRISLCDDVVSMAIIDPYCCTILAADPNFTTIAHNSHIFLNFGFNRSMIGQGL